MWLNYGGWTRGNEVMIGGSLLQHDIMISPAMILSHYACRATLRIKDQTGQTTKQMPKGHPVQPLLCAWHLQLLNRSPVTLVYL
jgi:hypothetical protein